MRVLICICLVFSINVISPAQETFRGSIPEYLLRPSRGESSRYPADMVIGQLGQGRTSSAAFSFANTVAAGLLSGRAEHPALVTINSDLRQNYLSALARIYPHSFRLGGGREEADGAVSFLIRFIGRDYGITGELYIRYITRQIQGDDRQTGNWVFEELLLEDAKRRDIERQEFLNQRKRLDFMPYERFF